jgi:hypothetical protein
MKEKQEKLKLDGCEEGSISSQSFYFSLLFKKKFPLFNVTPVDVVV